VAYFSPVETDPNVVLRFEPAPFTTLMIITEIDAAMRPIRRQSRRTRL